MTRSRSAAREARRALLAEGGDPLGVVRTAPQLALIVALDVQLLRQRAVPGFVDRLLGAGQPAGGRRSKLPRQAVDRAGQLAVFHAAPDETPRRRLLGRQLLPEERQTQGTRRPDQA